MNPYSILGEINVLNKDEKNDWFSYIPRFNSVIKKMDLNLDGKASSLWELQLKAVEDIGLGTRNYNLTEVYPDKNDF